MPKSPGPTLLDTAKKYGPWAFVFSTLLVLVLFKHNEKHEKRVQAEQEMLNKK